MSADPTQAARQAADNRKMHLETLRQQLLMYPTSAIQTVWREGIESALADVASLTRERDALNTELDERLADIARMREEAKEFQALHAEETAALKRERDALRAEADDDDRLRFMMAKILTDTANALKGTLPHLEGHDWSDLAEQAAALKRKLDALRSALLARAERQELYANYPQHSDAERAAFLHAARQLRDAADDDAGGGRG
jgi:uncharacterized coiled-coil DUF342 family protein